MAFTPRSAKLAKVRYGSAVVTAKAWNVNPKLAAVADVTNFEGSTIAGPDGTLIIMEQKLACAAAADFTVELDADSAANLYDAGVKVGNSATQLKLYLNDVTGPFWSFPTPIFTAVPMKAGVKETLAHTITGEGSGSFVYPTGSF